MIILLAAAPATAAPAYSLYFGGTHSHTSFSDGQGTPAEAFDFARNEAHLDFWAVTDHYEQLDFVSGLPDGAPRRKEWDVMRGSAADKTEPGKFVALAGYEWFDQSQGHLNVLHSDSVAPFGSTYTLDKFYRWVAKHPEAYIGFNHPGDPDFKGKFNMFAYVPQVASQTVYCGVNQLEDFQLYFTALDKGWRVGPVSEQDNHQADWGLKSLFTGVYATSLTYDGIFDALANRRFYATTDRGIRLWFEGNGQPMGSVISGIVAGAEVALKVAVAREGGKPVAAVHIISNGGSILKEWSPGADKFDGELKATADGAPRWFVAVVLAADGAYAISAPVIVK